MYNLRRLGLELGSLVLRTYITEVKATAPDASWGVGPTLPLS
jgi:hypothetical protein